MNSPTLGQWIRGYLGAALAFCAMDALWLGVLAIDWYRQLLGPLLAAQPRWDAAIAFYVVYLLGVLVFGVRPGLQARRVLPALGWGAAYGFFAYWTYGMTNLATLAGWPAGMAPVDLAWGTAISGVSAAAGCALALRGRRAG